MGDKKYATAPNPLPHRLRQVIAALGLDEQKQLAALLGVSQSRFSNYMAEVTPRLGWDIACLLHTRAGVNIHYLITGQGDILSPRAGLAESPAGYGNGLPPIRLERILGSVAGLNLADLQALKAAVEVAVIQKIVAGERE